MCFVPPPPPHPKCSLPADVRAVTFVNARRVCVSSRRGPALEGRQGQRGQRGEESDHEIVQFQDASEVHAAY